MNTEVAEKSVGRPVSELTVAVRALLSKHNGQITASAALPLLKEQGHEISPARFNIVKTQWSKQHGKAPRVAKASKVAKKPGRKPRAVVPPPRKAQVETNLADVVKFIESMGGLTKARQALAETEKKLAEDRRKLAAFEEFQKRLEKVAS